MAEGSGIDEDKPLQSIFRRAVITAELRGRLTGDELLSLFGTRALGPVLVLLGLVATVPPIGAVPGVPTVCGVLTFLVSFQFVVGRRRFWLPRFLGRREASAGILVKTEAKIHKVLAAVDKLVRARRFHLLTGPRATRAAAGVACLLAVFMPPLEIIPFGVAVPGIALIMLGLGLTARDGLFILFGLTITAAVIYLVGVVLPTELFYQDLPPPAEIDAPVPQEAVPSAEETPAWR